MGWTASPAGPRAWPPQPRSRVAGSPPSPRPSRVDVGGERLGEQLAIQVQVHPLAAVGVGERHRSERRRDQAVREDLGLKELLDAFALVGHPPAMKTSACTCWFPVA